MQSLRSESSRFGENELTRDSRHDPMIPDVEKGPEPDSQINFPQPPAHHGDRLVNTQTTHQLNGPGAVSGAPRGGRQAICAYPWSIGAANGNANPMFAHANATTDTSKLRSWRLRKSPH
jgi:hypothetical protein